MRKSTRLLTVIVVMGILCLIGNGISLRPGDGLAWAAEPEPVRLALITSLSGDSTENGTLERAGIELAVKRINEAGGIKALGGAKIELIIEDYTSNTENTKSVVERVLSRGDIIAGVGGGTSGLVLPTLPVWESHEVPLVTHNNADNLSSQGYEYVFSIHCRASSVGQVSVEFIDWLKNKIGIKVNNAALIFENSAKGMNSANGARATIKRMGMNLVFDDSHPNTLTDATALVTSIKASGADVCFIYTIYQVCKLLFTAMQNLNYNPVTITGNSLPSFYSALGESMNGVLVSANWFATNKNLVDNPAKKAITDEFEKTYGYFMEQCAGGAYSAVMVIAQALEQTGSRDKKALRDAIAAGTFDTLLAGDKITLNATGANDRSTAVIGQWQNGKLITIYPEFMASGEYIDPAVLRKTK
ncbi:MAG: ABC transporter substrate-binding protein [Synergistaceae bacterium]|jgi:branched-chain amino acid transport system substrate-binding protein|nr:ABC transporter substrate-binding protein [Synergistaceae bacterium]